MNIDIKNVTQRIHHNVTNPSVDYSDLQLGREIEESLKQADYKDLGWLNSGIVVANSEDYWELYNNWRGTRCIYISHKHKAFYQVDMGD